MHATDVPAALVITAPTPHLHTETQLTKPTFKMHAYNFPQCLICYVIRALFLGTKKGMAIVSPSLVGIVFDFTVIL
ncbi:hypothetical protein HOV93_11250 [Planctomycetes bacterium FF15]|uniref:Uncharacterized protein n=1 Tax=Bremerella alba TaxID=980252 RepID=A0A7V9A678_9BACT|nr:hypothetical protein [Bremerella alba]